MPEDVLCPALPLPISTGAFPGHRVSFSWYSVGKKPPIYVHIAHGSIPVMLIPGTCFCAISLQLSGPSGFLGSCTAQ